MSIQIESTKIDRLYFGGSEVQVAYLGTQPIYVCPFAKISSSDWTDKYGVGDNDCAYHFGGNDAASTQYVTKTITVSVPTYLQGLVSSGATVKCKMVAKASSKIKANFHLTSPGKEQGYVETYITTTVSGTTTTSSKINSGTVTNPRTGSTTIQVENKDISCIPTVKSGVRSITFTLTIACTRLSTANVQNWDAGKFTNIYYQFYVSAPSNIVQTPDI